MYGAGNVLMHLTFAFLTLVTYGLLVFPWIVWANTGPRREVHTRSGPIRRLLGAAERRPVLVLSADLDNWLSQVIVLKLRPPGSTLGRRSAVHESGPELMNMADIVLINLINPRLRGVLLGPRIRASAAG